MALEIPDLDDRTYDQIKNELLLRIPRYTPEWTDFNPSDPGVTMIELFAWLAESIGYRLNQAPERCMLTFLGVLGITPKPARPATTDLTFTVRQGETAPILVPAATAVASSVQTDDGPIVFETERGLELIPLRLQSVQVAGPGDFELFTLEDGVPPEVRPFGADPQLENALYLGFGPAGTPVTFPQQLSFLVDLVAREQTLPSDARLQWEYRSSASTDRWSPLDTFEDASQAFTRRGYVTIAGPQHSTPVVVGKDERPLHWFRCRLAAGHYAPGQEPVIGLLRYNTVKANSLSTVTGELAGQSDGRTGQVVRLRHRAVLPETVRVTTVPPPGQTAQDEGVWTTVADLVESTPEDRHVVVDGSSGELRFGDGRRGQVPVAGYDIVVSYRYGGSELANVARDTVTTLQAAGAGIESVTNLRAAAGGADEETAASLQEHAASRLRARERAVTAEDYRQLARSVGGVADAVALERRNPDYPKADLPGCVTVAVLPFASKGAPGYASPELLEAVLSELEPARTIGTELFVRSARFLEVVVTVVVEVDPYAAFGEIRAEVERRLDAELTPSAGGSGSFGRKLYPTALFGVVKPVPGVVAVPLLTVTAGGRPHPDVSQPVDVLPDQVVVPGTAHHITVRPRRDR